MLTAEETMLDRHSPAGRPIGFPARNRAGARGRTAPPNVSPANQNLVPNDAPAGVKPSVGVQRANRKHHMNTEDI